MLRAIAAAVLCATGLSTIALASARGMPERCSDEHWIEAQAIVRPDDVGAPISGIAATLSFDPETQLRPCQETDGHGGWAGAFVNLARYDRAQGVSGELLQLGIVQGGWEHPLAFMHTLDSTGGGMVRLDAPYPEPGRAYTFLIALEGGVWDLRVVDAETWQTLHHLEVPATWTEVASAWTMLETLDGASLIGTEGDAPRFERMQVDTPSGPLRIDPPSCDVRRVDWSSASGWTIGGDTADVVCSVDGGSFSAWREDR